MNLQHKRIAALCEQLSLSSVPTHYPALAQQSATQDNSFTDFLEAVLKTESGSRQVRSRSVLSRMAGFWVIPSISTPPSYQKPWQCRTVILFCSVPMAYGSLSPRTTWNVRCQKRKPHRTG